MKIVPTTPPYSRSRHVAAWGVHLLTASGAVCCLLSIDAGIESLWRQAIGWLVLAVFIDAIDGTLARAVDVKRVLPNFSGDHLDNMVDYASYVLVPAFLIHRAALLPDQWSWVGTAGITLASAYQFCQSDAKTPDHYFKGFPSYWNIAVLYLLALQLPQAANLAIILTLIVLVFIPIKYVYPSRTPDFRTLTLTLTSAWGIALMVIVLQLPNPSMWVVYVSLLFVVYYVGLSLYLTLRKHGKTDIEKDD
ncbi:MAG: CDP-alcohol phosphatidyltransferase family protein [Planctomycetota bacterium]